MARTIAFTSGKGGVGKTNLCANLAVHLAGQGYRVCVFDADLGTANINILFGQSPRKTIADVIVRGAALSEVIITDCFGIDIIPGSSGLEELANLDGLRLQSLIEVFSALEGYDFILFDTGAGVAKTVVAFCLAASEIILVMTPEPTSLLDAYALLKILCMNGLDRPVRVVVNGCRDGGMGRQAYARFQKVVDTYLCVDLHPLGQIGHDFRVSDAVRRQRPFVSLYPDSAAAHAVRTLAHNLLRSVPDGEAASPGITSFWKQCLGVFQNRLITGLAAGHGKLVKRTARRFPLSLEARYGFNGQARDMCRLSDISRDGMAIRIRKNAADLRGTVHLAIDFPSSPEPIRSTLQVRWATPVDPHDDFACRAGGVLADIDASSKIRLLEYAYTSWFQKV
jgi:flagellar biosynthesis protein FlhG